jgi:hypothetical protein
MFATRPLRRTAALLACLAWTAAACTLLAGCGLSAFDAFKPKEGEQVPVDTGPKRAWGALQSADAAPVWNAAALPAGVSPVAQERLEGLTLGMSMDAMRAQVGAPHATLKDANAEEVWQYVIVDAATNRAFIGSFWFGAKGLWLATGRSRPVGQLATINFGPQLPAGTLAAPPPVLAEAKPAAGPNTPGAQVAIAAAPPSGSASAAPAAPGTAAVAAPAGSARPAPAASAPPGGATGAASAPPASPALGAPSSAAPAGSAAAEMDAAEEAALRAALAGWLDDWSRQNVSGYLARYSADFVSPGKPRDEWEKERRARLAKPKFIRVKADQVKVRWPGSVRPQLEFVQRYESNTVKDVSLKVLTFVKRDGRWLIEQEDSAPLPLLR